MSDFQIREGKDRLFICYAHKDKQYLQELVEHLNEPYRNLDVWYDKEQLMAGDRWDDKIQKAIDLADAAILLMSSASVNSNYIRHREVEPLRKRRRRDEIEILPFVLKQCGWDKQHEWLKDLQVKPDDKKPLLSHREEERASVLAQFAEHVCEKIRENKSRPFQFNNIPQIPEGCVEREEVHRLDEAWTREDHVNIVVLHGLAGAGKSVLLRQWLDKRVATTPGLRTRGFGWSFYSEPWPTSGERASIGVDPAEGGSAEGFIRKALEFFRKGEEAEGDRESAELSPWDRGRELACLITGRKEGEGRLTRASGGEGKSGSRALLAIDGLEPLQRRYGPDRGEVTDEALATLLQQLAGRSEVLCVITSRRELARPGGLRSNVEHIRTDKLPDGQARSMLREAGFPTDDEFFREFGELARYPAPARLLKALKERTCMPDPAKDPRHMDRDVRKALRSVRERLDPKRHPADEEKRDLASPHGSAGSPHVHRDETEEAQQVVDSVLEELIERLSNAEQGIMEMLAFFDRPMELKRLEAFRKERPDSLKHDRDVEPLASDEGRTIWEGLERLGLVLALRKPTTKEETARESESGAVSLDVHSLVRRCLAKRLRERENGKPWQEGHEKLYDLLQEGFSTLDSRRWAGSYRDLRQLYEAVWHGCMGPDLNVVWDDLFYKTIRHKIDHYPGNELGCWKDDLAALSCFFDRPWEKPKAALDNRHRAIIFSNVGYDLMALARLEEAKEVCTIALDYVRRLDEGAVEAFWGTAAGAAGNVFKACLPLGEIQNALEHARVSIEHSDKAGSEDEEFADVWRVVSRTWLGDALWRKGRLWESEMAFRRAEEIHNELHQGPDGVSANLVGRENYRYSELLLEQARFVARGWVQQHARLLAPVFCEGIGDVTGLCPYNGSNHVLNRLWQVRARTARQLRAIENDNERRGRRSARLEAGLAGLILARGWLIESYYLQGDELRGCGLTMYDAKDDLGHARDQLPSWLEEKRVPGGRSLKAASFAAWARGYVERAVEGIRKVGHQTYYPRALLLKAAILRVCGRLAHDDDYKGSLQRAMEEDPGLRGSGVKKGDEFDAAETVLDEALEIITRGKMRLHEADYHLEKARLHWHRYLAKGDPDQRRHASLNLADAQALVYSIGYGRRDAEIAALKEEIHEGEWAGVRAIRSVAFS